MRLNLPERQSIKNKTKSDIMYNIYLYTFFDGQSFAFWLLRSWVHYRLWRMLNHLNLRLIPQLVDLLNPMLAPNFVPNIT